MRFNLFSILFLFLSIQLSAQEKKANQLYENLGYLSAAEEYQNLEAADMTFDIKEKLANSFRLNSQFESAEYWYAQIVKEATDPTTLLHYAQMLQSNGKCEDAIRWFEEYQNRSEDKQRSFIKDCKDLDKFEKHKNIKVDNLGALNSDKHDFSPIPYKNGLLFTSMRGNGNTLKEQTDKWTNANYSDLYFVEKKADGYGKPKTLKGDINGEFHDGVATINAAQGQLIFTRNTLKGKSNEGVKHLKIYAAKGEGDTWKSPIELSFCDNEYSSCHPTISADGQRLYFSSDRPGGFGGMDIYVVKRIGSRWGAPTNLGPIVNTSGNEIFPFISQRDKLFFASNGHQGIGGLDIFVVEKTDDSDEGAWGDRKNLGKPFNTKKDDFGFYIDAEEESGYLSSNRVGGSGADDIYEWQQTEEDTDKKPFDPNPDNPNNLIETAVQSLAVCDAISKEKIADAKVAILKIADNWLAYQEGGTALPNDVLKSSLNGDYSVKVAGGFLRADASLVTNEAGTFDYFYHPQQMYALFAEKDYYYPGYQQMTGLQIAQVSDECLYLQQRSCVKLQGKVKNKQFPKFIAGAEVTILDKCTGETTTLLTGYDGAFEQCLDCNCEYLLTTRKLNFKENSLLVSTMDMPCETGATMDATIELELDILDATDQELSPDYVNQYFTGEEETTYEIGQVLTLNNIYYDFDNSDIRADAAYELDYLIALLEQHPSMDIELAAHTDSRGETDYNRWLSRARAKSAKQYLLNHGITKDRIHKSLGFGETRLSNDCANDVECTEAEHQLNRRTEVTIVKLREEVEKVVEDDFK